MPRRREIPKRELQADPLYSSPLVTRFINTVMRDGKRSTAESILYGSFDIIKDRTGDDPLKIFKKALENVKVASVNKGVVLLSGKAETLDAKLEAIERAAGVPGVRRVSSEIEAPER